MWETKYISKLTEKRIESLNAGGESRVAKQHEKGKMTARERIEYLFDKGTFVELESQVESRAIDMGMDKKKLPGDGVIIGFGKIGGRLVYASSEDFTVMGGSLGEAHAKKICRIMDLAYDTKAPYISINDCGGARIEEGIMGLSGYADIFYRHTRASGIIPQIAVIMGPCAGGACYAPAICDFIFVTESNSRMFITGPSVVKAVVGEEISDEELGGAKVHMEKSGVAHFSYVSDEECLDGVRMLLTYLPQNNNGEIIKAAEKSNDTCGKIQEIVPDNPRRAYDVHDVFDTFIDSNSFFEIQKDYGQSMVVGFARMDGDVLGIVANQPKHLGGSIDIAASEKAARFVRFCDCFRIPLLTMVDVPGFMPGTNQEFSGIIRRGAKLLYAYSEATVPKVSLIMRKAYGGAYIAMNSKGLGADVVYAWPIAQIAVMGAEGAVDIISRREIAQAEDKEAMREAKIQEYNDKFMSPYIASSMGYVDEVIMPEETKEKIKVAFDALKGKKQASFRGAHGNIPL